MNFKALRKGGFYFFVLALLFFVFMFFGSRFMEGGAKARWDSDDKKIGLIRVEGIILDSQSTIEEIHRYRDDIDVKAILLRIDSPGGGVVPSQEIYTELRKIRLAGMKKVVTSMGTVAASGGYYIASASEKIIANPGTLTGSIGVIMEMPNMEELFQKVGVSSTIIKSGANKDIGSPFRKMTDGERLLLQNVVDDIHSQFVDAVVEGRSLDRGVVQSLADGRVFTGRQAKSLGLVDELGDLQDAVRETALLAGIQGEPHVLETKKKFSFSEMLRSQFSEVVQGVLPSRSIRMDYIYPMGTIR